MIELIIAGYVAIVCVGIIGFYSAYNYICPRYKEYIEQDDDPIIYV